MEPPGYWDWGRGRMRWMDEKGWRMMEEDEEMEGRKRRKMNTYTRENKKKGSIR